MENHNSESIVEQIQHSGYCKISQVYHPDEIQKALKLVLKWKQQVDSVSNKHVPFLNRNQEIIYNLQNKECFFLNILFSSTVLQDILIHFLNDIWVRSVPDSEPNYILRSYLARSSCGALPLHIDSFVPYLSAHPFSMQVAIILEDQNEANGCTLVVPGSHTSGAYATQDALDQAVPVTSKAGDVVIWDSRLWHATSANLSAQTRWSLIATYTRWWLKQAFNIPQSLPQEIYDQLTDQQKSILGFCSIPYRDELEGIDMKRGYDTLKENVIDYNISS